MTFEERQRQSDLLALTASGMFVRDIVREIGFYTALLAMPALDNPAETETLQGIYRIVIKQSIHLLKSYAMIPEDCL